jgi:hypothetical protein
MHVEDAPRIGASTGSVARLIAIETAAASGQFPTKESRASDQPLCGERVTVAHAEKRANGVFAVMLAAHFRQSN